MSTLALFDLDHTLLDIDSDYTWGEYIVKKGLVNEDEYRQANQQFYEQYIAGTLDATEYNEFVAGFLTTLPMEQLHEIRQEFIESEIVPFVRPDAKKAISMHFDNGDEVLIISATNDFVVLAIAQLFEINNSNVLATPLEIKENRYTGKLSDRPNFQAGKLYHLQKWMNEKENKGIHFEKTIAYSDSKNDLPLLEWADTAVCVTPDNTLTSIATERAWKITDWSL